ncbi:endonuclease domain-containing protein [Siculibacillus lacustris]|uniref:Endonuclease domain-containing protein n=2 Tax=Siculibacillus lacustris TaxID=1549641 RepID=A0A4Q9VLV4_9HYPH|nr:endonuclease domain-containing protein [Siculibacillus lacustris]
MPGHSVPPILRANAKRLRRSMTLAESRLWSELRGHRFVGSSFRRQVPIGVYIADFLCPAARLVIEVDGGQHGEDAGAARDARRSAWFAAAGYRVLRFWNHDVLTETTAVLDAIWAALAEVGAITGAEPPLPVPPPPGGRERSRRGGGRATAADDAAPRSVIGMSSPPVPSPLEGEGQGGGAAAHPSERPPATMPTTNPVSSAPKTGPAP